MILVRIKGPRLDKRMANTWQSWYEKSTAVDVPVALPNRIGEVQEQDVRLGTRHGLCDQALDAKYGGGPCIQYNFQNTRFTY